MILDAIEKTDEIEASVTGKDDNVVNEHIESNIEESEENIDKEGLGEGDDAMEIDVGMKKGESETNHEVTSDKNETDKILDPDQKEAEIDADVQENDDTAKAKNNANDIKDSADDTEASNDTKPDVKTEYEPMDFEETSRYSTRGLRNRVKAEPVNVKKEKTDEVDVKIEKAEVIIPEKPAVAPTPSKSVTRWHLVCETLDDWVNLAEWFKDSAVRCEKALSKEIRENFLPVLPEIIEARVSQYFL